MTVRKTPQQRRIDTETFVNLLIDHYPKCFFSNPNLRRPLKHNILDDIKKDSSFDHAPEDITEGVQWYMTHYGYEKNLVAGAKRIDLKGHAVDTVTEQEAVAAQQRVDEINAQKNDKAMAHGLERVHQLNNPIPILNKLHADNQISDCAVKKQDAPMLHKPKATETAMEFAPLYEILNAANVTVVGSAPSMRAMVAKLLLNKVIQKFQQVESEMEET